MDDFLARFDWQIGLALLIILLLGLVMGASVFPQLFFHQAFFILIGFFIFILFAWLDYRVFQGIWPHLFLASVIFLFSTFIFGTVTRGSIRWISLGPFTLQPSELVKPFLILSFAGFILSRETPVKFLKIIGLLVLPALLTFFQPDLGSTLVLSAAWLGVVIAAGVDVKKIMATLLIVVLLLPLGWQLLKTYQRERIYTFVNPYADPLGSGYNVIQSQIAVGSGQIAGRGLGRGTQSHLRFLPERHTDFVFASLAEELGILGSGLLLAAFALLLARVLGSAFSAREEFGRLVAVGIFSLLFFQVFVNVGMNLGLVPITGITLPLVSYGGSSLVSTMIGLGVVTSVARLRRAKVPFRLR